MKKLKRGIVEVYHGIPNNISSSPIGLLTRAAGHDMGCLFVQFLGNDITSLVQKLDYFQKKLFDVRKGDDIGTALEFLESSLVSRRFDIVVADEILTLLGNELTVGQLRQIISSKPFDVELVLTGKDLPKDIYNLSELVTKVEKW